MPSSSAAPPGRIANCNSSTETQAAVTAVEAHREGSRKVQNRKLPSTLICRCSPFVYRLTQLQDTRALYM